jgi:hypothetical protein
MGSAVCLSGLSDAAAGAGESKSFFAVLALDFFLLAGPVAVAGARVVSAVAAGGVTVL